MNANTLYSEMVLDHARHPRGLGDPSTMPFQQEGQNPSCGDFVCFGVSPETPVRVVWRGNGCALCMASASLLSEHLNAHFYSSEQAAALIEEARRYLSSGGDLVPFSKYRVFSNLLSFPSRVKCAALSCSALLPLFSAVSSQRMP
jgi:nitrogen fixation protein NifU and related proteins